MTTLSAPTLPPAPVKDDATRGSIFSSYKNETPSVLDAIDPQLDPIQRAKVLSEKLSGVGFDFDNSDQYCDTIKDEVDEFQALLQHPNKKPKAVLLHQLEDELGDVLYSVVNMAHHFGLDPEKALNRTLNKISLRFRILEELADRPLHKYSYEKLKKFWSQAKLILKGTAEDGLDSDNQSPPLANKAA